MAQDIPQLIATARGFLTSQAYAADERLVLLAIVEQLEQTHAAPTLSRTRVSELLDYASVYGEFDETTPIGTVSTHDTAFSEAQLHAVIAYKRVLCLLPDDWAIIPESTKIGGQG